MLILNSDLFKRHLARHGVQYQGPIRRRVGHRLHLQSSDPINSGETETLNSASTRDAREVISEHNANGDVGYQNFAFAQFMRQVVAPESAIELPKDSRRKYQSFDVFDFSGSTPVNTFDIFPGLREEPWTFNHIPRALQTDRRNERIDSSNSTGISLAAQAFKESPWLFIPKKGEHGGPEDGKLFPPVDEAVSESVTRFSYLQPLTDTTRDTIFSMILGNCNFYTPHWCFQNFPGSRLLDKLIHSFLYHHSRQASTWIHVPTISINDEPPEFLLAMIIAGAALSPFESIRNIGAALYEPLRTASGKLFEADNRNIRKLRPLQTMSLLLDIGLWSGDRRKMEISESFANVIVTMVRRGGVFRQRHDTSFAPKHTDDEMVLHEKWKEWVEHESFKRLVFHLLVRDALSSMSFLAVPLMSFSEMCLDLPATASFWSAVGATAWARLSFERPDVLEKPLPSPSTLLNDFSELALYRDTIDPRAAIWIILSGFWIQIWHCSEMLGTLVDQQNVLFRSRALIIESMHHDIIHCLEYFRMAACEWTDGLEPMARILYEQELMALHAPLEDVQLLAGKGGEGEARRVLLTLKEWSTGRKARQALFHAGQLIRAASEISPEDMMEFSAVAVYHASVVLWAYAILSPTPIQEPKEGLHADGNDGFLRLDEDDGPEVQRFIALGLGIPAISFKFRNVNREEPPIAVQNIRQIMAAIATILRVGTDGEEVPSSPLIENLSKLMQTLGYAAHIIKV